MESSPGRGPSIRLIESEDEVPKVALTPGKRFEVVLTPIVDTGLNEVSEEVGGSSALPVRPPRLCGSRSTCLAIVEIE